MKKRDKKNKFSSALGNYSQDGKAAVFTLAFAYIYLICEIIIKMKTTNKVCTWEIVLLFLMYALFGFFKKLFGSNKLPTDFSGNPLPLSDSEEDIKVRTAYYRRSALIYSLIFAVINFFSLVISSYVNKVNIAIEILFDIPVPNIITSLFATLLVFAIVYFVSYMIEYLWNESKINSMLSEMKIEPKAEDEVKTEETKEETEKTGPELSDSKPQKKKATSKSKTAKK